MILSIIIINYKSAHHVLNCLESIYKETKQNSFEIIVVDNNSGDDSYEIIHSSFPNVIWLQMGYNSGFARANNEGIKIAKGEYILLLNADTIVLDGALDKTIGLFAKETDAVGCGLQLLNPDGTHQISGAYFVKGGLNFLLPLPYLGSFVRYLGYKTKAKVPSVQTIAEKQEIDWIVGAFILIRKSILEKAGLLDEDFFMYAEEIEWCSRLRRHGKLYLFEKPKVIHLLGGTSNSFYNTSEKQNTKNIWNKKGRQIMLSNLVRIRKQYGVIWFLISYLFYVVEIPIFFLGFLFSKLIRGNKATYFFKNFIDYSVNVAVISTYFFRIILNNPFFYKLK